MEILNIALFDLIKLTRERASLIMTFLMPLIFIGIMGSISFGDGNATPKIPVGIVNYDTGKASLDLMDEIKKDNTINVDLVNEKKLMDNVKNANIDVGFIIPENYSKLLSVGKVPEIKVLKLPSSADFMVIEGIVQNAYSRLGLKNAICLYFDEKAGNLNLDNKNAVVSEARQKVDKNLQTSGGVLVESKIFSKNAKAKKIDGKSNTILGFTILFARLNTKNSAPIPVNTNTGIAIAPSP